MTDRTQFKEGEIIVLTSGAYSDYFIIGVFRVLKDFDTEDYPTDNTSFYSDKIRYQELINNGSLEDIDHSELWVGGG